MLSDTASKGGPPLTIKALETAAWRPSDRTANTAARVLALLLWLAPVASYGGPPGGFVFGVGSGSAPRASQAGASGDDRVEATRLLRRFVGEADFECLLVLRASARNPGEVMLFVCEEDDIHLPDLRGFVSTFRIGLGPTESASIDLVHNHPERLLIRTHSSPAASYSERRRLLGLHGLRLVRATPKVNRCRRPSSRGGQVDQCGSSNRPGSTEPTDRMPRMGPGGHMAGHCVPVTPGRLIGMAPSRR